MINTSTLQSVRHKKATLIRLIRIASPVNDILGIRKVLGLPLKIATIKGHERSTTIRRTNRATVQAMRRSKSVCEVLGVALRLVTSIVKNKLLRSSIFAKRPHLFRKFGVGLIPSDTFPLPFTSFSNTTKWIKNTLRIVSIRNHPLCLRAKVALGIWIKRITIDFTNEAILHPTNDSTVIRARETNSRSCLSLRVIEATENSKGLSGSGILSRNFQGRKATRDKGGTKLEN